MQLLLRGHDAGCDGVIWLLLRLAVIFDDYRRWVRRHGRRLAGSLRRLLRRWLVRRARVAFAPRRKVPWNRTAAETEEDVVRLHVEQPQLGLGQLMRLSERVLGFFTTRETIRRILLRRRDLIGELEALRRQRPRSIDVRDPGVLWAVDLTLLWVLGFFPVWVVGVVDYYGSRVVAFERVGRPNSSEVARVLENAFDKYGVAERILTDRAAIFTAAPMKELLERRGARHSRIRPGHAWTNGRIERVFKTFKETVFGLVWLFTSRSQIDRFCADFVTWYNRDRPHSRWGGRTPDEVYFHRRRRRAGERVTYFDGRLRWWRLGFG